MLQLKVREHPILGPYVENLTACAASSYDDVESGSARRAAAAHRVQTG